MWVTMGCYIVTEDFVYPTDKKGREYGWVYARAREYSKRG